MSFIHSVSQLWSGHIKWASFCAFTLHFALLLLTLVFSSASVFLSVGIGRHSRKTEREVKVVGVLRAKWASIILYTAHLMILFYWAEQYWINLHILSHSLLPSIKFAWHSRTHSTNRTIPGPDVKSLWYRDQLITEHIHVTVCNHFCLLSSVHSSETQVSCFKD